MINKLFLIILILFLFLLHLGSFFALFFYFNWSLFFVSLFLWQFLAIIGISVCYHREITHRSFKSILPLKIFHLSCAMLAGQAGPILWAHVHRIHHKYSDKDNDPHSPKNGLIRAHFGWIFEQNQRSKNSDFKVVPKDLADDKILCFFQRLHFPALIIVFFLLYYFGGIEWFLWLGCFRVTLTLHSAWVINSLGHFWGYQNYETKDHSKNNKIIALLTAGEGFHNNHHFMPNSINMGHKKGEIDIAYYYILLLKKLGWISNTRSI